MDLLPELLFEQDGGFVLCTVALRCACFVERMSRSRQGVKTGPLVSVNRSFYGYWYQIFADV